MRTRDYRKIRRSATQLTDNRDWPALKLGQRSDLLAHRSTEHHEGRCDRNEHDESNRSRHGGKKLEQQQSRDRQAENTDEQESQRHRGVFAESGGT